MAEKQPHDDRPRCGRPKSRGRGPCGSIILGPNGACRAHGGFGGGAPEGNKNALKTGRYETILFDVLEDDERELALGMNTEAIALLDEEIRLVSIRERRMLQRIAALKAAEGGMTIVEETSETIAAGSEGGNIPDRILSKLDSEEVDELTAAAPSKDVQKTKQKRLGTLGQIQAIEADLTAVQTLKAKLIKQKHDLEMSGSRNPDDDADFDGSLWEGTDDEGTGEGS